MQASDYVGWDIEDLHPAGMRYRRLGEGSLQISSISLSLQCASARYGNLVEQRALVRQALDLGINHFTLTCSTIPASRAKEAALAKYIEDALYRRDDMVISAQIGFNPRESPVGFGSRDHVLRSLDAILRRTGLEYLDILCAYRYDPSVPLEETMGALASAVDQGKVKHVGLSGYAPAPTKKAADLLIELGTPAIVYFGPFSMLHPWAEVGLLGILDSKGIGFLSDAPLPTCFVASGSWMEHEGETRSDYSPVVGEAITDVFAKLAASRGQSLAGLGLSWVLNKRQVVSVLVDVTSPRQLKEYCTVVDKIHFSSAELAVIDSCR
ncbi:aldo/keto reductase [Streptomyces virginiae]|uniref:aldo/keto reductase n=1 Tax=Streptomyces virginiae TaxID=1961 RepID=UPI003329F71E